MASEDLQAMLARMEKTLQEVAGRGGEAAELLRGYTLGHCLAMSAVISLLIEKGVLDSEEIENRLLTATGLLDNREGGDLGKQALGQIVHMIRKERQQAN